MAKERSCTPWKKWYSSIFTIKLAKKKPHYHFIADECVCWFFSLFTFQPLYGICSSALFRYTFVVVVVFFLFALSLSPQWIFKWFRYSRFLASIVYMRYVWYVIDFYECICVETIWDWNTRFANAKHTAKISSEKMFDLIQYTRSICMITVRSTHMYKFEGKKVHILYWERLRSFAHAHRTLFTPAQTHTHTPVEHSSIVNTFFEFINLLI